LAISFTLLYRIQQLSYSVPYHTSCGLSTCIMNEHDDDDDEDDTPGETNAGVLMR